MRKPVIAGNWKMYKTPKESLAFLHTFLPLVKGHTRDEILLFPSITSLAPVLEAVHGSNVAAGAQNMHWLDDGAYTGQTSPTMLTAIGTTHVLLGHSECRMYTNDTDDTINLKLKSALAHGLVPVVCVGELLEKRQAGLTKAVLRWQIACALNGIDTAAAKKLIIAYEPVWAIGTGVTASPEQAEEAHAIIRHEVAGILGETLAETIRILYGGSVKPDNAAMLMAQPNIDGALVGGASLDPESFFKILSYNVVA
jgi:triosephosphate isomerase